MKTLDNVMEDMSVQYEDVKAKRLEIAMSAELTNIAGKFLKANQLKLAWATFHKMGGAAQHAGALTAPEPKRSRRLVKIK